MRVPHEQYRDLDLEVHAILGDVRLRDVTAVDLPAGGPGRTISDVRSLMAQGKWMGANPVVRFLFALRLLLGRLFSWDSDIHAHQETSYLHRLSSDIKRRSVLAPGSPDGLFRVLYVLERESLAELRNATAHAFLSSVLIETLLGYRLYLAVYVKPVSRLTPLYMAFIEPFRRFIVYPAIVRGIRRAWAKRYPPSLDACAPGDV